METSIPKIEGLVASPAQPIEAGHPARPMATKEIRFQTFEDQKKTFQVFCLVESFTVTFIEFY